VAESGGWRRGSGSGNVAQSAGRATWWRDAAKSLQRQPLSGAATVRSLAQARKEMNANRKEG